MNQIRYLILMLMILILSCGKHNDEPMASDNLLEADIDGQHWQADSAGATFVPINLTYGTNYFQLAGRTANGQKFALTTRSDAPSEAQFEVRLTSFQAKFDLPNSNGIILNWITANESNADRFDIERSEDAISFTKVGEVQAAGNSSTIINYEWHEKPPLSNLYYYRIRLVNTSGLSEYSTVVVVSGGPHQFYFSSGSDTAYHYGFNGTVALTSNDTITKHITGTFSFDYVDDGTGIKHTVRNGKFTNLTY